MRSTSPRVKLRLYAGQTTGHQQASKKKVKCWLGEVLAASKHVVLELVVEAVVRGLEVVVGSRLRVFDRQVQAS